MSLHLKKSSLQMFLKLLPFFLQDYTAQEAEKIKSLSKISNKQLVMQVTKVIKLQLVADNDIFRLLDSQSRICNWLYNHLIEQGNAYKQQFIETQNPQYSKTVYTKFGLRNLIPELKKEHPFLKTVHSSPLKNTALRLTDAIQAHQKTKKGKRKGQAGWPRFRSWNRRWFSLQYDEPKKGFKITKDRLKLSFGADVNKKRLSATFRLKE